mmetsp:Transcript_89770/g.251006  ORF Transcript_89770/g.251006 Transcript_89770/m.251006 type:complete len:237 (+) Transcript_89770:103-813(+)
MEGKLLQGTPRRCRTREQWHTRCRRIMRSLAFRARIEIASELAELVGVPTRRPPEDEAILQATSVPRVPLLIVLKVLKEVIELVVAELVHRNVLAPFALDGNVVVITSPLAGELVARDKANMDLENRAGQHEQDHRVDQVQHDDDFPDPHALMHHHEHQHGVHTDAKDGNNDQAHQHDEELAVVQEADYVGEPTAVVVVPADGPLVLPTLVRPLWKGRLRVRLGAEVVGAHQRLPL